MAGYLLTVESWNTFSKAWDRALHEAPSIHYLKMVEAQNLRGEFRHWSTEKKDTKLRQLATIIRKYDPLSFEFSVSRTAFEKLYQHVAPYGLARPHFVSTFAIVSMVTNFIAATEMPDVRVEFVFDRQEGVSTDIGLFFEYMSENLPENRRKLIAEDPAYEDDIYFPPLQAADMLAWHLRREHEDGQIVSTPLMRLLRSEMHYTTRLEADMLARWGKHHEQQSAVPKTKAEWKKALVEAKMLKESGFKPPHGDAQEIALARLEHLRRVSTTSQDGSA
jgi:hypothetical protein